MTPRSPRTYRLAAGAVLAATTLATGGFATLGVTAASAATPGTYTNGNATTWDDSGNAVTSTIEVPETVSQLSSAIVTLHGLTSGDVSHLLVDLQSPDGTDSYLLCTPQTVGGQTSVDGADVTFNTDGSGEPSCSSLPLSNLVGHPGNGTWTLSVSDNAGDSATQSITGWDLTLAEPATVTTQPDSQIVDSGTDATFTAAGEGMPAPTVQWQSSTDGSTWNDVPGATSDSYTVKAPTTAQSGTDYRAVYTSSTGSAASDPAELAVNGTQPTVTAQPASTSVVAGTNATFTAAATSDPASTVQWQYSADGGNSWLEIPDAVSDSYTVSKPSLVDSGTQYEAVYTNDIGQTTSNPATLTVTGTAPSAARSVTVTQTGPGKITIHWAAPSSPGTPASDYYDVGYSAGQWGNGGPVPGSATSQSFTGLAPGQYVASIAAVNAAGPSRSTSVPVTVVAPTTVPVAHASARSVVAGHSVVFTGSGPRNSKVTLQRAFPNKGYTNVTTVTTNSWGAYTIKVPVTHSATYRVRSAAGKVSTAVRVVSPSGVTLALTRVGARTYTLTGKVNPAAGEKVTVHASLAGKTVTVGSARTSKTGAYSLRYTFSRTGAAHVVASVASTAMNAAGGVAKDISVK